MHGYLIYICSEIVPAFLGRVEVCRRRRRRRRSLVVVVVYVVIAVVHRCRRQCNQSIAINQLHPTRQDSGHHLNIVFRL